jgi:hypothetical protein
MGFGYVAVGLSSVAAGFGVAAALRVLLLAVLAPPFAGAGYEFASGYPLVDFAVLSTSAALLIAAMVQLSRQRRTARTLLIVAAVAAVAVTAADVIVWPRMPGLVSYFDPVNADGYRWAWLGVIALTVVLVGLPVSTRWWREAGPVGCPPRDRVALGIAAVAAMAGGYQLWLFGTRLERGWTLLSLLSPPELIGAEIGSVIMLEAVAAALITALLLLAGAALLWRGRRSGVPMLQVGGVLALGQAVFLRVDVEAVFTDIGYSALPELIASHTLIEVAAAVAVLLGSVALAVMAAFRDDPRRLPAVHPNPDAAGGPTTTDLGRRTTTTLDPPTSTSSDRRSDTETG